MERWTILLMVLILLPFTECLSQEFPMTPEERYWFDLTGYLHIKGVLEGENLKKSQIYLNLPQKKEEESLKGEK